MTKYIEKENDMSNDAGEYFYVGSCGKVKAGIHTVNDGFMWEVYDVYGSYFNGTKQTLLDAVDYAVKYMMYLHAIERLELVKDVKKYQFTDFENCGFRNLFGGYHGR